MASLGLLLLSIALIHTTQSLPAGHGGGRGLNLSVGRLRRHLQDHLPYLDQMMAYPSFKAVGGTSDVPHQSEDWRGRGLDQVLQRLVQSDQRRAQEDEQRAAYLASLLHLLTEAPGEVVEVEEDDEEDDRGAPGSFQGYGVTGRRMGRPPGGWWGQVEPEQLLPDRMVPRLVQSQLQRAGPTGRVSSGLDQDTLRQLVARILSSFSPNNVPVMMSPPRATRSLSLKTSDPFSSAHWRNRRSLDDMAPLLPTNSPPLLRVKRLEDEEPRPHVGEDEEPRPHVGRLQRMKPNDAMATVDMEEMNYGSRRRRAAMSQVLIRQILEYMKE